MTKRLLTLLSSATVVKLVSTPPRNLQPLFAPRSVALVGASAHPGKWGHLLARGLIRGEHERSVYLVTRSGGEVVGRTAFASLAELPEVPELVVLAIPAAGVAPTIDAALAAGTKAFITISVGFRETGEEGVELERSIAARVREAGAVMVGPNCNGVLDTTSSLFAMTWADDVPKGNIALLSQSGNIINEVTTLATRARLGFSRLVSLGNQADVDAAELIHAFATDDSVGIICVYAEDIARGREFLAGSLRAREHGKVVVLISPPAGRAASRAAQSHTGSLLSDDLVSMQPAGTRASSA